MRVVDDKEFLDGVTAIAVEKMPQLKEQEGFRNLCMAAALLVLFCTIIAYCREKHLKICDYAKHKQHKEWTERNDARHNEHHCGGES